MIRPPSRSHAPPGARLSLAGVGSMPVIDEDAVVSIPPVLRPAEPLRVPQKSARRGSPGPGVGGAAGIGTGPGSGSASTTPSSGAPTPPPPYVPPYFAPYITDVSDPSPLPPIYKEEQADLSNSDLLLKPRRRTSRRCILGIALAVLVILGIGLGVGLSFGLRNGHSASPKSDSNFPAGSFSVKASIKRTVSKCTSNPDTWRCYPYQGGDRAAATFFWIISRSNATHYTVSSSGSSSAPSFEGRSVSLVDAGQPSERLHFDFSVDGLVIPGDKVTPVSRAAQCTYDDTRFQATLWTRHSHSRSSSSSSSSSDSTDGGDDDVKFGPWPGDIEIVQSQKGAPGTLQCEDSSGNAIADVQALAGDCECRWANY